MTSKKLARILLVLLLLPCIGLTQTSETVFKKQCSAIVAAFAKQDLRTLNKYVDHVRGVYIITRPGAIDAVNRYDSLSAQAFPFYPYKDAKAQKPTLKFGEAPKFNCGDMKWIKKGFYADTARYNRLSELMEFLTLNDMGKYSHEEREKAKWLESKSRKIVYTELAKKHGVVFYLTLINKKWYLTLIDVVASDCGA